MSEPDGRRGWEQEWGFDPGRRRLAGSYSAIRYRWALARPVLALGPLAVVAMTGLGRAWYAAVGVRASSPAGAAAMLGLTLFLAWSAWTAIWSYVSSFLPGRRYGLVTSSPLGWARDRAVTTALGVLVLAPAAAVVGSLIDAHPWDWWWRWWLVWAGATLALSYAFPVVVLPLFHRLTSMDGGQLKDRLLGVAARSGTPVRDIHVVDLSRRTTGANAFVTGLGATRRLALGDTLLKGFTPGEVEAVLAHELAHHRLWHLPLSVARSMVLGAGVFWVSQAVLPGLARGLGYGWPAGPTVLPLLVLVWMVLWSVLDPVEAAISRRQERQCDASALDLSSDPASFASAMVRLGDSNLADLDPPVAARLLLYTHPPIIERLEMARRAGVRPADVRKRLAGDA